MSKQKVRDIDFPLSMGKVMRMLDQEEDAGVLRVLLVVIQRLLDVRLLLGPRYTLRQYR